MLIAGFLPDRPQREFDAQPVTRISNRVESTGVARPLVRDSEVFLILTVLFSIRKHPLRPVFSTSISSSENSFFRVENRLENFPAFSGCEFCIE